MKSRARSSGRRPHPRALLVVPSAAALLLGVDAGLDLFDTWAPVTGERLRDSHGVLMVLGFVGSLVSLERAVALRRPVALLAPLGLSLGTLAQLHAATAAPGAWLVVAGALGLLTVSAVLWRRQRDDAVLVETMGAVLAVGAALLWRGGVDVPLLLPWLAGFLVLTIVGERLELARLAMGPRAAPTLLLTTAAFCVCVVASLLWPRVGAAGVGLTLAGLTWWLATHDVARRTVRGRGLTRFMGASMLAGQVWLGVAAGVWLVVGPVTSGGAYDAVVHAVFLGFTMSMVMAHAPVILPAVAGIRLDFHWAMWLPAGLLQVSLVVRLWLGDALGSGLAHTVGGVLNVVAVLSFFLVVLGAAALRATPPVPAGARP
ncbi:hypothetical protein IEQ44_10130 [Nocardioides sp. Y6]|uniref:NnrS family protein n=1 Tax=Nocardioides malaquae TaxID=2773426 RepID=A0ABR9RTW5_9ACTN|nr:hypothetical protein [Nocardioides malaquae]MBE7325016.1 hypothetical protein [Nocardioides malaquae]